MVHKLENTFGSQCVPVGSLWGSRFRSWLLARRKRNARKREIYKLLSCDEKWLKDIGVSRVQLVGELGYDPRELPSLAGDGEYRFMHPSHSHNSRRTA